MPRTDPAARKQYNQEYLTRIAQDPVLLEKRRKSTRECQAKRMRDPILYALALQRTAEWRKKNLDYRATWALKKKYGITFEAYWAMFDGQQGRCAICECAEISIDPRTRKERRLAVDHCHITGRVRGLLCYKCNVGIGNFGDQPDQLRAAAEYLERHASR